MTNKRVLNDIKSICQRNINISRFYGVLRKDVQKDNKTLTDAISIHSQITNDNYVEFPTIPQKIEDSITQKNFNNSSFNQIKKVGGLFDSIADIKTSLNTVDEKQCFFISDFPAEWINHNNIPLAFANDVCRLPCKDFSFHNQYLSDLAKCKYSIPRNALQRTLVLMCSKSSLGKANQKDIEQFESIGFKNYAYCSTKEEFIKKIHSFKPEILVIDTHGNFEKTEDDELHSYLCIEKEKLTADDIRGISPSDMPKIVFLSACNTRPPQELDNCIVDAFIETGTLAITGTYVPLSVDQGIRTIARFIKNLEYAAKKMVHPNWLSFIAHLERTFFVQTLFVNDKFSTIQRTKDELIFDIQNLIKKDSKNQPFYDDILEKLREIPHNEELNNLDRYIDLKKMADAHNVSKKIFLEAFEGKIKLDLLGFEQALVGYSKKAREYFYQKWIVQSSGDNEPEHLFYTNYGRMDLIPFSILSPSEQNIIDARVENSRERVKFMAMHFKHMLAHNPKFARNIQQAIAKNRQLVHQHANKIGRNDPCPCGSGKKFKKCCGI